MELGTPKNLDDSQKFNISVQLDNGGKHLILYKYKFILTKEKVYKLAKLKLAVCEPEEMLNCFKEIKAQFEKDEDINYVADNDVRLAMRHLVVSTFYLQDTPYKDFNTVDQTEKDSREAKTAQAMSILDSLFATADPAETNPEFFEMVTTTLEDSDAAVHSKEINPELIELFEEKVTKNLESRLSAVYSTDPNIFPNLHDFLVNLNQSNRLKLNIILLDDSNPELIGYRQKVKGTMWDHDKPMKFLFDKLRSLEEDDSQPIHVVIISQQVYLQEICTSDRLKGAAESDLRRRQHVHFVVEMSDHSVFLEDHSRASYNSGPILRIELAKK